MLSRRHAQGPVRSEAGQSLILFVLILTITFAIGAAAVDIGLWLSERRGSQTDADFVALAGAWELLDPGATEAQVIDAANEMLADNDEQLNASFVSTPEVDFDTACVSVDLRHDSRPLFFEFFGLGSPDIGAHAVACAGAAQAPGDLVPFHVSDNPGPCFDENEEPIFTALCPIENGANGDNPRGLLDLDAEPYCSDNPGGANTVAEVIEWGAEGTCLIDEDGNCDGDSGAYYDCVYSQNGNPAAVLAGVQARVARDGDCDANYGDGDGVDEFDESVILVFDTGDPYTSIYEARDCDPSTDGKQKSPRHVTIIVLEEPIDTNGAENILAFAGFWLAGCGDEREDITSESQLEPDCVESNALNFGTSDLYVMAPEAGPLPAPNACHQGTPHGQQTCAPTATPTPSPTPPPGGTPTPTPSPTPGGPPTPTPSPTPDPDAGACPPGHCTVFGRFVNLITSGGDIANPNDQTTLFGIALVE